MTTTDLVERTAHSRPLQARATPLLEARAVSKRFGGVQALKGVDLAVEGGEVHALLGENGAGKSTLIKVISGAYAADAGTLFLDGEQVGWLTPVAARVAGITALYQERNLVPQLTVAENIVLGCLPSRWGRVRWREVCRLAQEALAALDVEIDPSEQISRLSTSQQRLVELARALHRRSRVLIFDEPTAALSALEIEHLFAVIRRLRDKGLGIVYVSHHLGEVFEIADRATVLRDGKRISTRLLNQISLSTLVHDMVGQDVILTGPDEPGVTGPVAVRLEGVEVPGKLERATLEVRRGEIVGAFGAAGAGQAELARILFGLAKPGAGRILIDGHELRIRSPYHAISLGVCFVPDDRTGKGLVPQLEVAENIFLAARALEGRRLARWRTIRAGSWKHFAQLSIRAPSPRAIVATLSGGNQQKVMFAKWLEVPGSIYVLEAPTAGVDVAAKEEIHELIASFARAGAAVLVVSSDIEEVMRLCHRILVLRKGRVVEELRTSNAERQAVVAAATGASDGRG